MDLPGTNSYLLKILHFFSWADPEVGLPTLFTLSFQV